MDEELTILRHEVQAFETHYQHTIELAERDLDYYHHLQWSEEEAKILRQRGQPVIVRNLIRTKINFILGLEAKSKNDPRAIPRHPRQSDDAHLATEALRFVTQQTQWGRLRTKVFKDLLCVGWGGIELSIRQGRPGNNPRIVIMHCPWNRMFWDPDSMEDDFSDASYLGMTRWIDKESFIARYGAQSADESLGALLPASRGLPSTEAQLADQRGKKTIQLFQTWKRNAEGEWWVYEWTSSALLRVQRSPWIDEEGIPQHGYVWSTAYRDRCGNPYGEVRGMIDLQDEINQRASKALHAINTRQTYSCGPVFDFKGLGPGDCEEDRFKEEMNRVDGHVSLADGAQWGVDVGIIANNDVSQGNLQLLQVAMQQLDSIGPNAALQGKPTYEASGRALLAMQKGGSVEAEGTLKTLIELDLNVYRKIWLMIRQHWTFEEWIRITEDPRAIRWKGINQRVEATQDGRRDPSMPLLKNCLAELDVDIVIDNQEHLVNLQGEELERLIALSRVAPELANLPAEVWIELAELKNKAQLKQILQEMREQQSGHSIQEHAVQAKLENTCADTERKRAEAYRAYAQANRFQRQTLKD